MEADYILKNAKIFPVTSEPKRGNIVIKDGFIKEVNEKNDAPSYEGKKLDMRNKAVLPGLINTHTHSPMTLLRGIADDLSLSNWLGKLRPIESKMDKQDIYAGALLGCLEMIKNGITCFSDMYFNMEEVAEAAKKIGIKADLGYGMVTIDKDKEGIKQELNQGIDFYHKYQNSDLITTFLAPHSVSTCSPDFLTKLNSIEDARIQMHVAETKEEFNEVKQKHGKTPIELLKDLGLLKKQFLATHCVHVTENDLQIMKEEKTKVSHNPNSNMKLASGIAPVTKMNKKGITVSLGTDGAASNNSLNLFQEMKNSSLLQKVNTKDASTMPANKVIEMATINGAKALGKEQKIGSIEEGKKADLITIDLKHPSINPLNNIKSNLVYSGNSDLISSVFVDGELVLHEKQIKDIEESKVIKKAADKIKGLKEEI